MRRSPPRFWSATLDLLEPRTLLSAAFISELVQWQGREVEVAADRWIVQLDSVSGTVDQQIQKAQNLINGLPGYSIDAQLGDNGLFRVISPVADAVDAVAAKLSGLAGFRFAEPDFMLHADVTPNDTSFASLWGMTNIHAAEAWDISTGSASTVVGVIDTGVDYTHPDLAANIWTNPGEIAGNNIDDDQNGFVDDIRGWDFINGDNDPRDDNSHGTHVSGTIGAVGNNARGVAGVNWNVKIMALKFLGAGGSGPTSAAIQCVNYATMMHNRGINIGVTNNSWGGGGSDPALYDAIQGAGDSGMLFVAAAGNSGANLDAGAASYPASYDSPNIISVANITSSNGLSSSSNYGTVSVDLGAPGTSILSSTPNNGYSYFSGTSMASPHVAGVAGLLFSIRPGAAYQTVRDAILSTADATASLAGKTVTGGKLNAFKAAQAFASLPHLTSGSDSGVSNADGLTNVTSPTFTGGALPSVLVSLFADGNLIGQGMSDASGAYTIASSQLSEGAHAITATWPGQAAALGAVTVTIDTSSATPPAAALYAADDTGSSNSDAITALTTLRFTGTSEGGTVRVYLDGALAGTAVVGPGQPYTIVSAGLSDGVHLVKATVADRAGNVESAQSSPLVLTVKTSVGVPSIPDLDPTRDSASTTDNITKLTYLKFNGTSDGGTVYLKVDGVISGASNVAGGSYAVNCTVAQGTHLVTAYVVDLAGNISALSGALTVTVDTTRPQVNAADYAFDAIVPAYALQFSEDVHLALQKPDLQLLNLDSGEQVSSTSTALNYALPTNLATFTFPGFAGAILPDGNYQAIISSTAVSDVAGNALVDSITDFFVLAGDGNRDRSVDTIDFNLLAAQFSQPGPFSSGDFDYSGTVDTVDFNLLAGNFGKELPAPPPPEISAAARAPTTGLFGSTAIDGAAARDPNLDILAEMPA